MTHRHYDVVGNDEMDLWPRECLNEDLASQNKKINYSASRLGFDHSRKLAFVTLKNVSYVHEVDNPFLLTF